MSEEMKRERGRKKGGREEERKEGRERGDYDKYSRYQETSHGSQ